ncbi:hypothetical protein NMG60_11003783 [Bertholletia excelsa]
MNRATRPALLSSQANPFNLQASLFHSTPVLDRRRRTHWDSGGGAYKDSSRRFNQYAKRSRKLYSKQALLRNVSAFAEHFFQGWQNDFDEYDTSSSRGNSWFRREYGAKDPRGGWSGSQRTHSFGRRSFYFCEDDIEVENIFRSAFGGKQSFYWSFVDEDFPRWRSSSGFSYTYRSSSGHSYSYGNSWNWTREDEEDYESSTESDSSESDLVSDRLALGLSASGPLNMNDVKNAYRASALKWHPDRHQGSSKTIAEEKFKICSAAYQSLCDKLAPN